MITLLLLIIGTYILVSLFGYFVHWMLHQSWAGQFNSSHLAHHEKFYPPSDFLSDKYREAGKDDTFWIFALFSLPVLAFPIVLYYFDLVSFLMMLVIIAEMLFIGWLNTYIHYCVHINNHWTFKIPIVRGIFEKWQYLHYAHHIDVNKNFGIFHFYWDRIFGTFWKMPLSK